MIEKAKRLQGWVVSRASCLLLLEGNKKQRNKMTNLIRQDCHGQGKVKKKTKAVIIVNMDWLSSKKDQLKLF